MTTTLLPPPKTPDTTGDVLHNWNVWKSEFELFATATKLKKEDADVQAATFLMAIGEEARLVFVTFTFEWYDQKKDLKVLMHRFEAHFKPATNLTFKEFRFGSRNKHEGESFTGWLTELKTLAKTCEFGELEEGVSRSRIILGIRDKDMSKGSSRNTLASPKQLKCASPENRVKNKSPRFKPQRNDRQFRQRYTL